MSILPKQRERKVNALTEARNLKTITMDEIIGNLKLYKIMKMQNKNIGEHKLEKNLVLKETKETISTKDEEITYITKRVLKALRKSGALPRRGESSKQMKKGRASDTFTSVES